MRASFLIVILMLFILTFANSAQADPPIVIQQINPIVVDEDCGRINIVNLNEVFVDPGGRQLVFSFQNAPRDLNMEIDRNGLLFFEPSDNYNIPDGLPITIVAANAQGEASETRFMLAVERVNDGPRLWQGIGDVELNEDQGRVNIADLDDLFFDIEADELIYTMSGNPGEFNMDIDDNNILFINADENYFLLRGAEITVRAEDPDGEFIEDVFNLAILPVNDAPLVVNPIEDIVVDEDCGLVQIADLDDIFFDIEADEMTFSFERPGEYVTRMRAKYDQCTYSYASEQLVQVDSSLLEIPNV
ncbi:MAG: hypothetical protein HN356_07720, partial [Calditrichaeota bacterium]|nr:hypothetical protein [Calditrichota bacterium]